MSNSTPTPPPPPGRDSGFPAAPPAGAHVPHPADPIPPASASAAPPRPSGGVAGEKSYTVTWILSFLLGMFGADRFYLGKIGTGILKLVTLGGVAVWWLVDLIITLSRNATDKHGRKVRGSGREPLISWIVVGALVAIGLVINLFGGGSTTDDAAPRDTETATQLSAEEDSSTPAEDEEPAAEEAPEAPEAPAADVPADHASALQKAEQYVTVLHMSKAGLYDQLTAEFGEQFSPEAAQYAVDTIEADWKANALAKAEQYSDTMSMSQAGIYDQLTADAGEKFTPEEAQYAVDTMEADWNANALEKARMYQDTMSMSPEAIRDQLTSDYGEKFTPEQADYAIAHLNG